MLTLIIREIEDNRVFFIVAIILAVIFSVLFVYQQLYGEKYDPVIALGGMISVVMMIGFCAMGASQMYWDKTRKISALLATLAVTRRQIFIARVIAGILLIAIGFIPQAGTIITMISNGIGAKIPVRSGLYPEILIPVLLLGFACYCTGLQGGWSSNKVMPTLGAICPVFVLMPVVLIEGFGWEIYVILVAFIAACLIRAWQTFSTAAL